MPINRLRACAAAIALATAGVAAAQAPATEVFLAPLTAAGSGLAPGPAVNVTNNPGYDNQPFFLPDSSGFLFSSNRDGRQTDIYRVDVATRQVSQVTRTPDNEYSPTIMPGGRAFSTVRGAEQQLWAFNLDGTDAGLAYAHDGLIGYHAWVSPTMLALFILGTDAQPVTLQLADVPTRTATVIESRIGRSLHIRPGTGTVSFVHQPEGGPPTIKELDPRTRDITTLIAADRGGQDVTWTPDGRLLSGQGSRLFAWRPGETGWTEIADLSASGLTNITRLAVSPDGRWIAIVAEPRPRG